MDKGDCVGTIANFFLSFIIINIFAWGLLKKNYITVLPEFFKSSHTPLIHFISLLFHVFIVDAQNISYKKFYDCRFITLNLFFSHSIIKTLNSIAFLRRKQ